MGPIDWSWGEPVASPILTLHPQHPPLHEPDHATDVPKPLASKAGPMQTAGRKRSRAELNDSNDEDSSHPTTAPFPSTNPSPIPETVMEEPILGPGMTLIYPNRQGGGSVDAASQTGTWAEELAERLKSSSVHDTTKPELVSRKSMRLDKNAPGLDDIAKQLTSDETRELFSEELPCDIATQTLGIAWQEIANTPTMSSASRGWAKFIETHFPLQGVRIVWKNRSIPAYLVSASMRETANPDGSSSWRWHKPGSSGYYLFDEELRWGKLVAKDWDICLENLKKNPMVFEGHEILERENDLLSRRLQGESRNWAASMSNGHVHSNGILVGGGDAMELDV